MPTIIAQGMNGQAKIFTDNVDQKTIGQIINMLNAPITQNAQVRIMPDTHYGKGATIGTTIKLPKDTKSWKISPSIVGVDIACGMLSYKISNKEIDLAELDQVIHTVVPSGRSVHKSPVQYQETMNLISQLSFKTTKATQHLNALGTLGGGNHFIELCRDDLGYYWLTVHSGARSFGYEIATYHEKIAQNITETRRTEGIQEIIKTLTEQGKQQDIQQAITEYKKQYLGTSSEINYLDGQYLLSYLSDLKLANTYALLSRKTMLDNIVKAMNLTVVDSFDSVHNTIDIENGIIRKGSTSANKGERLLIPLNMKDGSLICIGKGNLDWNNSAPHGAGRILSRTQAKATVNLADYQNAMKGIYTTSVCQATLDEAPSVYKPAQQIIDYIQPTVEIIHQIKPVYNFKAKE